MAEAIHMSSFRVFVTTFFLIACACVGSLTAQSSFGSISGVVTDQNNAAIAGAGIIARNTATGFTRSATTDPSGRYWFSNIPSGTYELAIGAKGFAKYFRSGISLDSGQTASIDVVLIPGAIQETITVNENASMLNTASAEVSTRFDSRRLSELPIASNRSLYNILLSVPGVNQRANGQTAFAVGISFSTNGGRIRSNSFQLDGQDLNDPALGGSQIALNNPDAIQEVRIITNQFLPEHGHNAGAVVEIVGRSGTNDFHGSLFWFHNNEGLNACSNTDKRAGFCDPKAQDTSKAKAPLRRENQFGFTIGGPVFLPRFGEGGPYFYSGKDRTFFFADHQRWSDRRTPSFTIRGAPTADGRALLQQRAGNRPQVQALLRFVPAGTPNGETRTVTLGNGEQFTVPLGDLTNSSAFKYDSDQGSVRIDHALNKNNLVYARYRYHYESTRGAGQITLPGHGTSVDLNAHAFAIVWTSAFSSTVSNEARIGWKKYDLGRDAADPLSYSIPAIEIADLGLTGGPEAETRTSFGLPTNLPVFRTSTAFEVNEALSISRSDHALKFGAGLKPTTERSTLFSTARGSLVYATLNSFVNDVAQTASKGLPLPGSDATQLYKWNEAYFYAQDEWKLRRSLTFLYGIRYEYPGDSFQYLREVNQRVLAVNNNDPEFRFEPYPKKVTNNWMPRIGLNWNPRTNAKGVIGFITGGDKLVVRLGYARAYDPWIVNINQNIFTSFPFTATRNFAGENAYARLVATTVPNLSNPRTLTRIIVARDFRSPATDQFSFDVQRELNLDLVLRVGYIRTRGTGLFQTIQGNPLVPCAFGSGPGTCNTTGIDVSTGLTAPQVLPGRVDPTRGIISVRANSASSTYDALQASLEKRLSRGLSFGLHFTWSSLIDTASDIFSPSVAEAGTSQDPFDRNADRARGSYDRPLRLSGNFVYELPFFEKQNGVFGKLLGGWQVNSFFNFQSGAPFTPLNGADPAGVGTGGIRPNIFTDRDVSRMSIAELYLIDRQLRDQAIARAWQIFTALPSGPCVAGWLPGPPLPFTLFSAPRARITCSGDQPFVVDFNGILPGQRVGDAGRNILRSDSFNNVDIGIIKNTRLAENVRAQVWCDFFDAFNWRNFGIPSSVITDPGFLNKWLTDGGSRRIRLGARLVF